MIGPWDILMVLSATSPTLVLWIAVVVFAAVMLRRGGGRAERFLIAGAGIKIIGNLIGAATIFVVPWLADGGYDPDYIGSVASIYTILLNIISMAGIICLIYAFWVKFKQGNIGAAVEVAP